MTHDTEQSDGDIVAMKAANKGARAPAESLERRTPTERNPQRTGTVRTQGRGAVTPGAERIRQFDAPVEVDFLGGNVIGGSLDIFSSRRDEPAVHRSDLWDSNYDGHAVLDFWPAVVLRDEAPQRHGRADGAGPQPEHDGGERLRRDRGASPVARRRDRGVRRCRLPGSGAAPGARGFGGELAGGDAPGSQAAARGDVAGHDAHLPLSSTLS